jgi:hypothetical protein
VKRKGSFLAGAIFISIALSGCGESKPASPEPTPTIKHVAGCYVATLKQDKFILNITSQNGDAVSANVAFNNFEKDSSHGTLKGTFDGTILSGTYTFQSEGVTSIRDLFFKYANGGFNLGYGPYKDSDGTLAKIPLPADIKWDMSYTYSPSDICNA